MHPCCTPHGSRIQVGSFCRCCGEPLRSLDGIQECGRHATGLGPCPYCEHSTCGVHSARATDGSSARRFCEVCGSICDASGECPVHGYGVATGRFGAPLRHDPGNAANG